MMIKLRCSRRVAYSRLDELMLKNGWVHWSYVKSKFDELRKQLAAQNPIKYPDWKQVPIPMHKAGVKDLPAPVQAENEQKNITLENTPDERQFTPRDTATA